VSGAKETNRMKATEKKAINKAIADIEQMIETLTTIRDEWEDSFGSRSDKWQESDKGEAARSAIDYLTNALDSMESTKDDLSNVMSEDGQ
jgi:hypothetical protein